MANSWNGPQLGSPIRTDVPELQKKLIALLKQDPTSVANIPSGAKRLVNTSGVQWQVQQYNGSSWAAIGKLMHDVDKLDGYHAAITPAANTVAVRNANKKLEGDITGNAATASSAATLSETLPVNKGGTGATTSAAARTNLGVPPTSHASSGTTYGLGSNANYGHVRGDSVTTNVVSGEVVAKDIALGGDSADPASGRGLLNRPFNSSRTSILDLRKTYNLQFTGASWNSVTDAPFKDNFGATVISKFSEGSAAARGFILAIGHSVDKAYIAHVIETKEPKFQEIILDTNFANASVAGIMKPGDGLKAEANGIINLDNTVVRTNGGQSISGEKIFSTIPFVQGKAPNWGCIELDYDRTIIPDINQDSLFCTIFDKNRHRVAGIYKRSLSTGVTKCGLIAYKQGVTTNNFSEVYSCIDKDGNIWGEAPTPGEYSNTNHIATTEWVRSYTLPTGTLIPSLATSMTGYLLCNGAAVSRTTYANLFSIIGTKFGAGDGSTTFNLPDFRNRVFWGASGNLMSVIEAGLPDLYGTACGVSLGSYTGVFKNSKARSENIDGTPYYNAVDIIFSAQDYNRIYGNSTTVQPPAVAVNIFIKY